MRINLTLFVRYALAPIFIFLLISTAYASSIKLYYFDNGQRGWKGGHKTIEECEKAARRNQLSPKQYYCSDSQDYDLERRLGWRK